MKDHEITKPAVTDERAATLQNALQKIIDACAEIPEGLEGHLEPLSNALSEARAALSVAPAHAAPAEAMDALKAAIKADPEYAWSWHCAIWSGAYDEGLETGAANRAAARVMHMAFDCDTSEHENFNSEHKKAALAEPADAAAAIQQSKEVGAAIAPPTGTQHNGMTIAGNGASDLGKLMREQFDSRGGVYPDGNPNAGLKSRGRHDLQR